MNKSRDKRYSRGNAVYGTVICCMGTDGNHTCGEHSIMYRVVESICCTPETKVRLCVNYPEFFKNIVS